MDKLLQTKYNSLIQFLKKYDEWVVAYSGGVDSTLLLKILKDSGSLKVHAIIGKSPSTPETEFDMALQQACQIGVEPIVIETNELNTSDYCSNTLERCYHCKKVIFGTFLKYIRENGLKNLADGSNYDDLKDFRPGNKALEEFGVISPFKETGFTKNDIRELSNELKLSTWNKEALACLATRISYNEPITIEKLKKIEKSEAFLRDLGFRYVRVRLYGEQIRIETAADQIPKFFDDDNQQRIIAKMKEIGFKYITIDMEGYRMGSMNN
jgi:uncharacterized protein